MRAIVLIKILVLFAFGVFQTLNESASLSANNLQISNLTVDQAAKTVTFDISWDNSWYVTEGPKNWDAAWVFVKFLDCDIPTDPFVHGNLSASMSDHSLPDLDAMTSVDWDGTSGASESTVQAATLDYQEGIMLRRTNTGVGSTSSTVTLKVANMPDPSVNITVRVFGIEMVYVPKGDFYIGDGNGSGTSGTNGGSNYRFLSEAQHDAFAMQVTESYETAASDWYVSVSPTTIADVPAAWPKGNYGFYMMKYEITQGLYTDFLNTISAGQAVERYPANFNNARNRLDVSGGVSSYSTDRPDRAQNYLSWADVSAFLDWACLRPMTETEFEKTCRGVAVPFTYEYAWGNINISPGVTFDVPYEDGTEEHITGNCTYNNTSYTNGDGGRGPRRVGIFATPTSNREESGGAYYGVMDLSGNVSEIVIGLASTASNNVFTRTWGDGEITFPAGNHDVPTWPPYNYNPSGSNTNNLLGHKGGGYSFNTPYLTVSDRYYIYRSPSMSRTAYNGGRGIR